MTDGESAVQHTRKLNSCFSIAKGRAIYYAYSMKRKLPHFLLMLILFLANRKVCWAGNYILTESGEKVQVDDPSILERLRTDPIEYIEDMKMFLSQRKYEARFKGNVWVVTLKGGLKAVFKPCESADFLDDAYPEIAAYEASLHLGFPIIPPTVIRKIKGKIGSLQLYVKPSVDLLSSNNFETLLKKINNIDLVNLKLFYFIFGQWDSNAGNLIAQYQKDEDENPILVAIDNWAIMKRQQVQLGERPFLEVYHNEKLVSPNDRQDKFPFESVQTIKHPTVESIEKTFGKVLPSLTVENLIQGDNPLQYVLYQCTLWRQWPFSDERLILQRKDKIPPSSLKKLRGLNAEVLKRIFQEAKHCDFFNHAYIESILDRVNQVLSYTER